MKSTLPDKPSVSWVRRHNIKTLLLNEPSRQLVNRLTRSCCTLRFAGLMLAILLFGPWPCNIMLPTHTMNCHMTTVPFAPRHGLASTIQKYSHIGLSGVNHHFDFKKAKNIESRNVHQLCW
jgi:hypothetical protein